MPSPAGLPSRLLSASWAVPPGPAASPGAPRGTNMFVLPLEPLVCWRSSPPFSAEPPGGLRGVPRAVPHEVPAASTGPAGLVVSAPGPAFAPSGAAVCLPLRLCGCSGFDDRCGCGGGWSGCKRGPDTMMRRQMSSGFDRSWSASAAGRGQLTWTTQSMCAKQSA